MKEDIQVLLSDKSATSIDLSKKKLEVKDLEEIVALLPQFLNLTSLNLSDNCILSVPSKLFEVVMNSKQKITINFDGNLCKIVWEAFVECLNACEIIKQEANFQNPNYDSNVSYENILNALLKVKTIFNHYVSFQPALKKKYVFFKNFLFANYLEVYAVLFNNSRKITLSNIDDFQISILTNLLKISEINKNSNSENTHALLSEIFKRVETIKIIAPILYNDLTTTIKETITTTTDCKLKNLIIAPGNYEESSLITLLSILKSHPTLQIKVEKLFDIENDSYIPNDSFSPRSTFSEQIIHQLSLKPNWKKIKVHNRLNQADFEKFITSFSNNSQPLIVGLPKNFDQYQSFSTSTAISGFEIPDKELNEKDIIALIEIIKRWPEITYLNASHLIIDPATDPTIILKFIQTIAESKIKEIDFSNSNLFSIPLLYPEPTLPLCRLDLLESQHLESINLSTNRSINIEYILQFIKKNHNLKSINLSGIPITEKEIEKLANLLQDSAFHVRQIKFSFRVKKIEDALKGHAELEDKLNANIIKALNSFPTKNLSADLELSKSCLSHFEKLKKLRSLKIQSIIAPISEVLEKTLEVHLQILNMNPSLMKLNTLTDFINQIIVAGISINNQEIFIITRSLLNWGFEEIETLKQSYTNRAKQIKEILNTLKILVTITNDDHFFYKYYFEYLKYYLREKDFEKAKKWMGNYFTGPANSIDSSLNSNFILRYFIDHLFHIFSNVNSIEKTEEAISLVNFIDDCMNYLTTNDCQSIRDLLTNYFISEIPLDNFSYDEYQNIQARFFTDKLKQKSKPSHDLKFLSIEAMYCIKGLAEHQKDNGKDWEKEKINLIKDAANSAILFSVINDVITSLKSSSTNSSNQNSNTNEIIQKLEEINTEINAIMNLSKDENKAAKKPTGLEKNSDLNKPSKFMTANHKQWVHLLEKLGCFALLPDQYYCQLTGVVMTDPVIVQLRTDDKDFRMPIYERSAIKPYFFKNSDNNGCIGRDPKTGFGIEQIISHTELKSEIERTLNKLALGQSNTLSLTTSHMLSQMGPLDSSANKNSSLDNTKDSKQETNTKISENLKVNNNQISDSTNNNNEKNPQQLNFS